MARVRLREGAGPGAQGSAPVPEAIPLRPLHVSGVVVTRAHLVEALQVYVPGLVDIQVTEDGGHFWLLVEQEEPGADSSTPTSPR